MPLNTKIFRTSTFRLAAIYLAFFTISVMAIMSYVYWNTAGLIERQTDTTISAEIQALADQYRAFGIDGVAETIKRRSSERTSGVYILADDSGKRLAGNLDVVPSHEGEPESGWIEFPIKVNISGQTQNRTARAFHTDLSGDYELVVGRDVGELKQFNDLIRRTLISGLLIALVLGLGGGWLMSRNFLRRVDAITGASRTIMSGDLSSRMPVTGTNDELDRLAHSLNQMLDQIERLMIGMKDVTSNVAHDLKTPLTRMRARVESALRSDKPDDYRAALHQTINESESLLQTFDALLSIARTESGQSRDMMRPFDAEELVVDVGDLFAPTAEEAGGSLTVSTEPGLHVVADRQLLAQAISNLVDNALKYGVPDQSAPEISLSARRVEDMVVFSVGDRGPGIAEADRVRVLDRFVRLEESRTKPGNGLGLSLVAGIVRLHGGTIRLSDNQPGLRVELLLPYRPPAQG